MAGHSLQSSSSTNNRIKVATSPGKILIIRFSSIGDIILTTTLVRVLKAQYPDACIHFLVKTEYQSLLQHNPYIDQLFTLDKKEGFAGLKKLCRQIKAENYDLLVDLHNSLRSRYLRMFAGIRNKRVYSKYLFKRTMLVRAGINLYKSSRPVYLRYIDALNGYSLEDDGKGTDILFSAEDKAYVDELLKQAGYNENSKLAVLCPGARHFTKQWPAERYTTVAQHLSVKDQVKMLLLGGPDENNVCEQITSTLSPPALNLAGKLSLLQSAALLSKASLAVTNDSGLLHLAQSQKVPVVAIYGSTTEELGFFPLPQKSRVVQVPLSCRPCSHIGRSKCPKGHFKCMNDITEQMVIGDVDTFL
jgi:heptosyltransferase-2